MKKKFLITDKVPDFFTREIVNAGFEVIYSPGIKNDDLKTIMPDIYAILVRSSIKLDKKLLEAAKHLKIILRPGSGLDIIDLETAGTKGITILNSPEGNRNAVGEHATGLLLSLLNHIPSSFNEIRDGLFDRRKNTGTEIKDKTIAIIGFGNTGSAFAEKLVSFGVNILAYDKYKKSYAPPSVTETSMQRIFSETDIISFHIPLTAENFYLVNKEYLKKFRKPVYLINTSRGKILEIRSLLWAIENKIVIGAALDVLENENLEFYSKDEKHLLEDLISTGKVIITPHIAGLTEESEKAIFQILVDKLLKYNNF